jgi:dTDP-4-amino-4,6-dideoxygalactose transaminase
MRIQRTVPPAAAPLYFKDLNHGLMGVFFGKNYTNRLENEIKEYFGVRYVFLVSSGKAALFLILKALKKISPKKDKVLIPAYTCFSVPSAVIRAGLKVSLCDINPETMDFNYDMLEETITKDTLCVIPCNLFGISSDIDRLNKLCRDRNLFVVEDVAQAMGGTYNGKLLGTIGDVGFFSLGRGKNITCGSGGIIVTNSERIANAIEQYYFGLESSNITNILKEFFQVIVMSIFIHPFLYWLPLRLPFLKLGQTIFYKDFPITRFSGMKAGLLWKWQDRLKLSNQIRMETGVYFTERLWLKSRQDVPVPYPRLPFIVDSKDIRNRIYSISYERGLGIGLMYPSPINEIEELKSEFNGKVFPSASKITERLLTLPTHQFLSEKDKKEICKLFNETVSIHPSGINNQPQVADS